MSIETPNINVQTELPQTLEIIYSSYLTKYYPRKFTSSKWKRHWWVLTNRAHLIAYSTPDSNTPLFTITLVGSVLKVLLDLSLDNAKRIRWPLAVPTDRKMSVHLKKKRFYFYGDSVQDIIAWQEAFKVLSLKLGFNNNWTLSQKGLKRPPSEVTSNGSVKTESKPADTEVVDSYHQRTQAIAENQLASIFESSDTAQETETLNKPQLLNGTRKGDTLQQRLQKLSDATSSKLETLQRHTVSIPGDASHHTNKRVLQFRPHSSPSTPENTIHFRKTSYSSPKNTSTGLQLPLRRTVLQEYLPDVEQKEDAFSEKLARFRQMATLNEAELTRASDVQRLNRITPTRHKIPNQFLRPLPDTPPPSPPRARQRSHGGGSIDLDYMKQRLYSPNSRVSGAKQKPYLRKFQNSIIEEERPPLDTMPFGADNESSPTSPEDIERIKQANMDELKKFLRKKVKTPLNETDQLTTYKQHQLSREVTYASESRITAAKRVEPINSHTETAIQDQVDINMNEKFMVTQSLPVSVPASLNMSDSISSAKSSVIKGEDPKEEAQRDRVEDAVNYVKSGLVKLLAEIERLGEKNYDTGLFEIKFGLLFKETGNIFDALTGVLKTAKKLGLLTYEGEVLFQGTHDDRKVTVLKWNIDEVSRDNLIRQLPSRKGNMYSESNANRDIRRFGSGSSQFGNQTCSVCSKQVYPLEYIGAADQAFHRWCFRCSVCNNTLSSTNYACLGDLYYCLVHYEREYMAAGGYRGLEERDKLHNRSITSH